MTRTKHEEITVGFDRSGILDKVARFTNYLAKRAEKRIRRIEREERNGS